MEEGRLRTVPDPSNDLADVCAARMFIAVSGQLGLHPTDVFLPQNSQVVAKPVVWSHMRKQLGVQPQARWTISLLIAVLMQHQKAASSFLQT